MSRLDEELELFRAEYPDLEFLADGSWVRIPRYPLPAELWRPNVIQVAFQIPPQMGIAPYAFHVRPLGGDPLDQVEPISGGPIGNYSFPATTPWGTDWGTFSWGQEENTWLAAEPIRAGSNMARFVATFADRFAEGA